MFRSNIVGNKQKEKFILGTRLKNINNLILEIHDKINLELSISFQPFL